MKKIFSYLFVILVIAGCGNFENKKPVIVIDDIKIYQNEFDTAFKDFSSEMNNDDDKKDFIDTFIMRKLILKKAEELGLDKDKELLADLQIFWEKALYKLVIERKMKELSSRVAVSDLEVQQYYVNNKETDFVDVDMSTAYPQIKWFLTRKKQQEVFQEWADSLKDDVKIYIDNEAIGLTK
ncbi:MAG: hypothetical protein PHZ27_03670 [Candidatus Omnitrophica bacterium]|nr:hypothetical protein [Candidatus Omnitrophota bacterium]